MLAISRCVSGSLDSRIASVGTKLAGYNQELAVIDEMQNGLVADEETLGDLSERMLTGVGARFGKRQFSVRQSRRHSQERAQDASQDNQDDSAKTSELIQG